MVDELPERLKSNKSLKAYFEECCPLKVNQKYKQINNEKKFTNKITKRLTNKRTKNFTNKIIKTKK